MQSQKQTGSSDLMDGIGRHLRLGAFRSVLAKLAVMLVMAGAYLTYAMYGLLWVMFCVMVVVPAMGLMLTADWLMSLLSKKLKPMQ